MKYIFKTFFLVNYLIYVILALIFMSSTVVKQKIMTGLQPENLLTKYNGENQPSLKCGSSN